VLLGFDRECPARHLSRLAGRGSRFINSAGPVAFSRWWHQFLGARRDVRSSHAALPACEVKVSGRIDVIVFRFEPVIPSPAGAIMPKRRSPTARSGAILQGASVPVR